MSRLYAHFPVGLATLTLATIFATMSSPPRSPDPPRATYRPRPPTPLPSEDSDDDLEGDPVGVYDPLPPTPDEEGGPIGVYWMDDPPPPAPVAEPAPFIVGTPWLNATHITPAGAETLSAPNIVLGGASQSGSGWDYEDLASWGDGQQGWGDNESPPRASPPRSGPLYTFTLPLYSAAHILSNGGEIADNEGSPEMSLMDLEDPVDTSDWEPWYLTFVVATRTCAVRRAAVGLPPAPCSRYEACERCRRLPGANPPAGYWLFMSDEEVEQRIRDGGYDVQLQEAPTIRPEVRCLFAVAPRAHLAFCSHRNFSVFIFARYIDCHSSCFRSYSSCKVCASAS